MSRTAKAPERGGLGSLWQRPQVLNVFADVLFVAGTLALGYALVRAVMHLPLFPLQELVLVQAPRHVTAAQIEYAARSSVAGNFFTVDLDAVKAALEKLPWVRRAEVRRRWPATLEVGLEEHVPAAVWQRPGGDTLLLSTHGELFNAAVRERLPVLSGPDGTALEVLRRYGDFSRLLAPLGRKPHQLSLSDRLAWQLRLDDGLSLRLGRDEPRVPVEQRLQRFVAAYPRVAEQAQTAIVVADLRYPNGFALRAGRSDNLKSQ